MRALDEPLISSQAASSDPFYAFRDELKMAVEQASVRFDNWKRLLENTNTARDGEFKQENQTLKTELAKLLSNIGDLEQVVSRVSSHREQFPHITDDELMKRKMFVKETKQEVNSMDSTMRSQRTLAKIERDERQLLTERKQGIKKQVQSGAGSGQDGYMQDQMQMQQEALATQDEYLGDLENSLHTVKNLGEAIGSEIETQNQMLYEFDNDLQVTRGKMEGALVKMDKMLKTKSRCQTYTILSLFVVMIILIILVSV